jgi:hypothetical protein
MPSTKLRLVLNTYGLLQCTARASAESDREVVSSITERLTSVLRAVVANYWICRRPGVDLTDVSGWAGMSPHNGLVAFWVNETHTIDLDDLHGSGARSRDPGEGHLLRPRVLLHLVAVFAMVFVVLGQSCSIASPSVVSRHQALDRRSTMVITKKLARAGST